VFPKHFLYYIYRTHAVCFFTHRHTHTHTHTQPKVVCNRGFQGGQQDRQFNLREREGWWKSKRVRFREIEWVEERQRGEKVMARTCLWETERKNFIPLPLHRERVSERKWVVEIQGKTFALVDILFQYTTIQKYSRTCSIVYSSYYQL